MNFIKRKKNQFIILISIFVTLKTSAQIFLLDNRNCNMQEAKLTDRVLELIRQNKSEDMYLLFSPAYQPDKNWLQQECKAAAAILPDSVYLYLTNFDKSKDSHIWQEITYGTYRKKKKNYLFQLFIQFQKEAKTITICELQFRYNNQIIKRDQEVENQLEFLHSLPPDPDFVPNLVSNNINTVKTSKHINIPGTRLYLIPPPGFQVQRDIAGTLLKGSDVMIQVLDLVEGNFYRNAARFNKFSFELQGFNVFDFRDIQVGAYPAKYIFMEADSVTAAHQLTFGDSTFSVLIIAKYPITDGQTGDDIITALNTIYFDKQMTINASELANFTLDDRISPFKLRLFQSGFFIYSINGSEPSGDPDAPRFLVIQYPASESITIKSVVEMT